jgi:outer membrane murein-binding lipoprotein Lpp
MRKAGSSGLENCPLQKIELLRYERLMSAAIFDTHVAATRYRAAGFSESQVEALVETAREATELPDISTLATKTDLERLALVTKSDVEQLGGRLDAKIDQLGTRLDGRIEQLDGRIDQLGARLDGKIDQLGTRLDGKIDQLRTRLDGKVEQLDGKIGQSQAELKAAIASNQLQTVYFVLTANVALTVLSTWLTRLVR